MEKELSGRYITYQMITPLLDKYPFDEVIYLGSSVKGIPINLYRVGKGNKKYYFGHKCTVMNQLQLRLFSMFY